MAGRVGGSPPSLEALNEANQKGWCDKELTNARQQRGYKADAVKALNSQLETAEAKRQANTKR